jgi:hypothetical protein
MLAVMYLMWYCVQDEKRFYQLELVNRETNFNKMFSTAPNVGVLNPLNAPTRVSQAIRH